MELSLEQIEALLHAAYEKGRASVVKSWNEADHPRGQPENAGEFAKIGTGKKKGEDDYKEPPSNAHLMPMHGDYEGRFEKYKQWKQDVDDHISWLCEEGPDPVSQSDREIYELGLRDVFRKMSLKMVNHALKHMRRIVLYPSVDSITEHVKKTGGIGIRDGEKVGGFWGEDVYAGGSLHVDGGIDPSGPGKWDGTTAESIYAHELGHAIDYRDKYSKTDEWQRAWRSEINQPEVPLSKYATTSPSEGFAEFIRLVITDPMRARKNYRGCFEFLVSRGLF